MYLRFQTRQKSWYSTTFIIDSGVERGHTGKLTVQFFHKNNYTQISKSIPYSFVENTSELRNAVSHCLNLEFDKAAVEIGTIFASKNPDVFSIVRDQRSHGVDMFLMVTIDPDTSGLVLLRTLPNKK